MRKGDKATWFACGIVNKYKDKANLSHTSGNISVCTYTLSSYLHVHFTVLFYSFYCNETVHYIVLETRLDNSTRRSVKEYTLIYYISTETILKVMLSIIIELYLPDQLNPSTCTGSTASNCRFSQWKRDVTLSAVVVFCWFWVTTWDWRTVKRDSWER